MPEIASQYILAGVRPTMVIPRPIPIMPIMDVATLRLNPPQVLRDQPTDDDTETPGRIHQAEFQRAQPKVLSDQQVASRRWSA